jgi:hypothetical protein
MPRGQQQRVVEIAIDSTVFYLNDILNTLNAIAGKGALRPPGNKAGGRGELGRAGGKPALDPRRMRGPSGTRALRRA